MAQTAATIDLEWSREQIEKYRQMYPRYELFAAVLKQILDLAAKQLAPLAIVQSRPKAIDSFAEKIQRKRGKYRDPANQITDLCGGRVITNTSDEARAFCEFIERHFIIDWENSVDPASLTRPKEFWYRSVHYIVQIRPGTFPLHQGRLHIPVEIPPEVYGLKAEIQVRTLLGHAWADFNHRLVYKCPFEVPERWQRELAALSATLERADADFAKIERALQLYEANYGNYMTEAEVRGKMELLKSVLALIPQSISTAHEIGKLALHLGEWSEAIAVLQPYAESGYPPILRDLGVALYKSHPRHSPEYRQGQEYLERACLEDPTDTDALTALASSWKDINRRKARDLYRRAFLSDPTRSYPLGRYLEFELILSKSLDMVESLQPLIEQAIVRCNDMVEAQTDLPWALYDMGKFHLLLRRPEESLTTYIRSVPLTTAAWMLDSSLDSVERWAVVRDQLPGYEWIYRLHLLARVVRFGSPKVRAADRKEAAVRQRVGAMLKNLATAGRPPLAGPVVIVAGGTDAGVEQQMQSYRSLLLEAFRDFRGTVISGGTTSGISGLVGSLQEAHGPALRTIGYLPREYPETAQLDERYGEIRYTAGQGFSPLEALQYWTDIVAAGIDPTEVKVIGIGGGRIAAAEYRLGLALGARVAIVEQSGREAGRLLADGEWRQMEGLVRLPADGQIVRAFVAAGTLRLERALLEPLAQALHEEYRLRESRRKQSEDPALAEWTQLPECFKESNRLSADRWLEHLRRIGLGTRKARGRPVRPIALTPQEIEALAEMEHARWVVERLQAGWTWGARRDLATRTNPLLVPWADLPEGEKEQNRQAARQIPALLARVGLKVVRGAETAG